MNDGIGGPWGWIWLGLGIAWGIRINLKYRSTAKREHLRDPDGVPYGAVWNYFSTDKWNEEGIAEHKQLATELLVFVVVWLALYFVLAELF